MQLSVFFTGCAYFVNKTHAVKLFRAQGPECIMAPIMATRKIIQLSLPVLLGPVVSDLDDNAG